MIRLICVGKLKEHPRMIAEEYIKRINGFTKIEITEINEYKAANIKESLKKEGERILEKADNFVVLDEKGNQLSSEEFSNLVKKDVTFVIGSHVGLSEEVKQKAKGKLSISKMTLPHQLIRVILLEQIYRAFTILRNQPYHK